MIHPFEINVEMRAGRARLQVSFYPNRSWLDPGNKEHVFTL
jgi:hypothetical protein